MVGRAPHQSKYGFVPSFQPIPELASFGDAKAQDAEAAKRNINLRSQIVQVLTLLGKSRVFGPQLVEEGRKVLDDLLRSHEAFKISRPNQLNEAPFLPSYRKALNLVKEIAKPGLISPEQEAKILSAVLPAPKPRPAFIRENFTPIVLGGGVLFFGLLGAVLLLTQ